MGCNCTVWSSRSIKLVWTLLILATSATDALLRRDDICGSYNGRRLSLELGERGILSAQNITMATIPRASNRANSSHKQCSLELITCPSCIISVTFLHLDLTHRCGGANLGLDTPCGCDYVWVSEPPNGDVSGVPFCGVWNAQTPPAVPLKYRSLTRTVSIVLLLSENHQHAFTLEYSAERNVQLLHGSHKNVLMSGSLSNESSSGVLKSPFFPALYPRDLGVEYLVSYQTDADADCRVRIIFRDFQLALLSIMEFYDSNGNRMEVSSGGVFRPPVILTTGPTLTVRFYANGGTGVGYKAVYSFVSRNLKDEVMKPITDCGGYVENFGGAITMMNMVDTGVKIYDCVWLIRPPKNYLRTKTHVYLKVATFLDMGGSTELKVLQGQTSEVPVIETLRHPVAQLHMPRAKEHIIPGDVGFYVSFRGVFSPQSRLAIVYAAFSYMDCFTGSDFLCQNHRCIPIQLNCDGFDHCGDNSDEPASCLLGSELEPQDRKWYAHTPNYYFPKMERYPDLKTATMVFIASSLGMVLLISALIVLLYHMKARACQQHQLHNQLQSISELLDGAHSTVSLQTPDEPPTYEAPPDYEEIIKVGLESSVNGRRKRKCPRQGGSPLVAPASVNKNSATRVATSATIGPAVTTSANNSVTPYPNSPSKGNQSCPTTPLPDSPPPPYMPPSSLAGVSEPLPLLAPLRFRARQSWLLFNEDLSSEDRHVTMSQTETSDVRDPVLGITAQQSALPSSSTISEGQSSPDHGDLSVSSSLFNLGVSVATANISRQEIEVASLKQPSDGNALLPVNDSLNSAAVRCDLESICVSNGRSLPQGCCDCQGACGCASVLGQTDNVPVILLRAEENIFP